MALKTALGMMSGTSLDGVDAAILVTDGEKIAEIGPGAYRAYAEKERTELRHALEAAADWGGRSAAPPQVTEAARIVTDAHAEIARDLMGEFNEPVDLIGFHGQTVFHAPGDGITIQVGDAQELADRLEVPVVGQFRLADVKAGGEGAPLAPAYHAAIASYGNLPKPACFLNLGGVSNLTYIGVDGDLIAFDAGPANALIDDWMTARTGDRYDENGQTAARGAVHSDVVDRFMEHAYFTEPAPKSLDRNAFSGTLDSISHLSTEDGAATLTAMTAAGIERGLLVMPSRPDAIVVAGGGAHNPVLCRMIEQSTKVPLKKAADLGLNGDLVEAQAFAFLAVRHIEGLPLSFPGTTAVPVPQTGGKLFNPKNG